MVQTVMHLDITEYRLRFERPMTPGEATYLRGWFGNQFRDEVLLHHHEADGSLRYDYPRVQFKVLEEGATLIGINEGGELVEQLWSQVDQARLRDEVVTVLEGTLSRRREPLGALPKPVNYCFLSPWVALNQENFHRYMRARDAEEKQGVLARILVGNCLSLAKSFDHMLKERIVADVSGLQETTCRMKDLALVAFEGTFAINFAIPPRLGVGKSVSRGFGTVQPLN